MDVRHRTSPTMDTTPNKYNHTKITYFLDVQGRSVLHYVFTLGTPRKSPADSLEEYFKYLPFGSTANYHKVGPQTRRFPRSEMEKIYSDPSCTTFDITLLYKIIRLGCEDMAGYSDTTWQTPGTLEGFISTIKNKRNDHFHGKQEISQDEFSTVAADLRQLFVATLLAAQTRYKVSDKEILSKIREVDDYLDHILQKVLGEEELLQFRGGSYAQALIQEGNQQVRQVLEGAVYLDPMSFLNSGISRQVHVERVFCKVRLSSRRLGDHQENIEHSNLLDLVLPSQPQSPPPQPQDPVPEPQDPPPQPQDPPPQPQDPVPQPQDPVPQPQDPVPQPQDPVPQAQDPVPQPQGPVPQPQGPVPQPQDPVPQAQDPVPQPQGPPPQPHDPQLQDPPRQPQEAPTRPQLLVVEGLAGSGKTTLVTFILNQWLKRENERSFRGLGHYDLLLRVLCRDQDSSSLQELLQRLMPNAFLKYRSLLLPLLKLCRVLFLIDGLDETNQTSDHLLRNILQEGKDVPNFSILCTSRPEIVKDFLSRSPAQYQISHVELLGVPISERTDFMVRYHQWLTEQPTNASAQQTFGSIAHLRDIMDEIGGREHFRLPLNLVFLAWVHYYDPGAVTTTTTQTQLYYSAHQLLVEKLLDRLARHSSTSTIDSASRKERVERVLKDLYRVALEALYRGELSLVRSDQEFLKNVCEDESLPHQELLSAFLSLKRLPNHLGVQQEHYSAPHKGLQEYYAAQHIAAHPALTDGSSSIKGVLKVALGTQEVQLVVLDNVLVHVAGLLHHLHSPVPQPIAEEVVDLLQESGVRDKTQWLDLLEDTRLSPAVLRRVAHHFATDDIVVADSRVGSYTALLPHLPPSQVSLAFMREPADLRDLFRSLERHTCTKLVLMHHYKDPCAGVTSDLPLQQGLPWHHLREFMGHLSEVGVAVLPPKLERVGLALASDTHAQSLLPALRSAFPRLPRRLSLHVHVPVAKVTPASLSPLPHNPRMEVTCLLSGVGDHLVEKACKVAQALQPSSRYWEVRFPRGTATAAGWARLLEGLAAAGVRVGGVVVPAATLTEDQEHQLVALADTSLGAGLWGDTEDQLWAWQ